MRKGGESIRKKTKDVLGARCTHYTDMLGPRCIHCSLEKKKKKTVHQEKQGKLAHSGTGQKWGQKRKHAGQERKI